MKQFTKIEPSIKQQVGGKFKKTIVIKRFKTEDGAEHEFTTFYDEDSVGVNMLAITEGNKVVVSKQFRPSPEKFTLDMPGGMVEPGESLEEAAKRELFEETGYQSEKVEYLGGSTLDSYVNFTIHNFIALNCKKVAEPELDPCERAQGLEVELISIDELIYNAKHNQMMNGLIVLMAYDQLMKLKKEGIENENTN